jgi:hypothetical protein
MLLALTILTLHKFFMVVFQGRVTEQLLRKNFKFEQDVLCPRKSFVVFEGLIVSSIETDFYCFSHGLNLLFVVPNKLILERFFRYIILLLKNFL